MSDRISVGDMSAPSPKFKRVHPPGQCFDPIYGKDCSGIATLGPDPLSEELGDDTPVWMCDGESKGRAEDV